MSIIVACEDQAVATAVRATLSEMETTGEPIFTQSPSELMQFLDNDSRDIELILVSEDFSGGDWSAVVREITLQFSEIPVGLLSAHESVELLNTAMAAGVSVMLNMPPGLEQFNERITRTLERARSLGRRFDAVGARPRALSYTIAVVGAKGGVGTSMISMLLAREFSQFTHTCLVDLDVRQGDLASYGGARVRRSIADLADIASEVGGRELSEVVYPLRRGVSLLPAPAEAERGEELTEVATRQIIQALRYQFDRVIIDCGCRMDDPLATALDFADLILVVSTPDVPSVRGVRRLREDMNRLDIGAQTPVELIVNKSSKHLEVQPASAAKMAELPLAADIPLSSERIDVFMNTATLLDLNIPAVLGPLQKIVRTVESKVSVPTLDEAPPPPSGKPNGKHRTKKKRRSLFSRRRGEGGQAAVEFAGNFFLITAVLLFLVQVVLWGSSVFLARNAAGEAARQLGVGKSLSQVVAEVRDQTPSPWREGLQLTPRGNSVEAAVHVPSLLPLPPVVVESGIVYEK